jgi:hypothetical protein
MDGMVKFTGRMKISIAKKIMKSDFSYNSESSNKKRKILLLYLQCYRSLPKSVFVNLIVDCKLTKIVFLILNCFRSGGERAMKMLPKQVVELINKEGLPLTNDKSLLMCINLTNQRKLAGSSVKIDQIINKMTFDYFSNVAHSRVLFEMSSDKHDRIFSICSPRTLEDTEIIFEDNVETGNMLFF